MGWRQKWDFLRQDQNDTPSSTLSGSLDHKIFLDEASASLLPLARQNLLTNVAFYFPLALVNIVRFLIQGMGFPPLATVAGLFEMAARGGLALLVPVFGYTAACFASPAAWVLADLFLIPAYFHCFKVLRLRHPAEEPRPRWKQEEPNRA